MKHFQIVSCLIFIAVVFIFANLVIGQDSLAADQTAAVSEEDLVHFGDLIDIDVVGSFEFDWRGTINPEGFLDGPDRLSEPVFALCRSEAEIAVDVTRIYAKILREPKILVRIIDRSNRAVAKLEGAVKTPTRFRLQRRVSLRELLVLSGGLIDGASGEITIFRPRNLSCRPSALFAQDNGSQTLNIKLVDILSGKPEANPEILSGDLITVVRAAPYYVIGAVNSPKPAYLVNEITVSRAVAIAGGLSKDADATKIVIFRRENRETKAIDVDLEKVKRKQTEDTVLKPFDIVDVASKGGGKRIYPPVAVNEVTDRVTAELPLRVVD